MTDKNKYSSFWIDDSYFGGDIDNTDNSNNNDVMRLASYKKAVSNFVNIVTNMNIPVKFETRGNSYTDGKTVTISSKINETDFDPIVGLALHEGSHIKLTDFDTLSYIKNNEYTKVDNVLTDYWSNLYLKHNPNGDNTDFWLLSNFFTNYVSPKIKDLVNVIEDRRIDHYIFTNAPGYKGYYESLYDKFFNSKQIDKGLLSSEYRTNDWSSYFFRIINFINKNRDLDALPMLRKVWNMIDLKNISRLKNTMEVVELAIEIFKVIEDSIQVENNGNKSNQNSSDDSTDGDGESGDGQPENSDGESGDGDGDTNNDSTDGDDTSGDANGSEIQKSSGNGELSERQKRLLDKAIEKQRKFLDGDVKKSKVSKTDFNKIEAVSESNVESKKVGEGYDGDRWSRGKNKTDVVIVNKLSKKLIDSDAFGYLLDTSSWRVERNHDNIMKGVQLGTVLGKRLKVRSEERSLITPRNKSGKISNRLIHELGVGNYNVFDVVKIDKHKPALVYISIDASGSMSGESFDKTQIAAVAIAKAASMTNNIDVVISYRTCNSSNNSNYPLMLTAYDSRVDKFSKVTQLFKHINASGTTPEGLCFEGIMNQILKVDRNVDTYFINFSDGMPSYCNKEISYGGREARKHTALQVKKMKDAGIKVLSYYISTYYYDDMGSFKEMYGKDAESIKVDSLIPLAKSLNKMFQ